MLITPSAPLPVPVVFAVLIQNGCPATLTLNVNVSPTLACTDALFPLIFPLPSVPLSVNADAPELVTPIV